MIEISRSGNIPGLLQDGKLNYEKVLQNMVDSTAEYLTKCNTKSQILGISGGIDSTVTAAICRLVADKTGIPLIGFSLPCNTNKEDETTTADVVGGEFCNEYHVVNIQPLYETTSETFASCGLEGTRISEGNIKARIRGSFLHNAASIRNGIVVDTDNATEGFLGFWTIAGGDVGEFNPIGMLWKHEVYELARYIKKNVFTESKSLDASIDLTPTDGNGVKEGGDLAQIATGKTYDDVDEILQTWVCLDDKIKKSVIQEDFNYGTFKKLVEKHGKDTVKGVVMRSVNSSFKRLHLPLVVDIFYGYICEKNGKNIIN